MTEDERARRARRREFIRTHHPDRGGDLATFITGLARLERKGPSERDAGRGRVTFVNRRPILVRFWRTIRGRHRGRHRSPRVR